MEEAEDRDVTFSGRAYARLGNSEIPVTGEVSLGRFYQQPALMELYGTFPGALSNPKLKREKATKFEASGLFKMPGKHTSLRAAYFESHIEDGICWVIVVEHLHAENIARSRVRGVEFELNSTPAKFLDVVLRATFQKTEDRSKSDTYNGNKLPGEPDRSYFAEATLHLPLPSSIAIDGMSNDHTDAATITPEAKPNSHFCRRTDISSLIRKTKAEPSIVPNRGISNPISMRQRYGNKTRLGHIGLKNTNFLVLHT